MSFSNENDISGLRKHEGYEEVKENGNEESKETIKKPDENANEDAGKEVLKKVGRPKKRGN